MSPAALATSSAHRTAAAPVVSPERRALAKRILLDALFLGSLGDALLHDGFGIGLLPWVAVLAVVFVYLVRQRNAPLTREQRAWLGAAVLFAAAFAWRDSAALLFYDFVAIIAALALLGATVSEMSPIRSILGRHLRELFFTMRRVVSDGCAGIVRAMHDSGAGDFSVSRGRSPRAARVVRATLLTLPLLLVFGLLFGEADPLFVSMFSLPEIDLGTVMSHVMVALVLTWVVGGWLYGAIADERDRTIAPATVRLSLGELEITIILGGLIALFALFVGVQVRWLFGGEQLVKSTTGLSYAEYARHGFFELVCVTLFVLPVLIGTRATLSTDDTGAIRRHRAMSLPLLALVAGVIASAIGRMLLYVHYYGLSSDRLFAAVFMAWLAVVFIWFGLTTLRGRTRDFAAGMVITGFMTLGALNLVNHEALVARVNVARASAAVPLADTVGVHSADKPAPQSPIDYSYLTSRLDADAVSTVVEALAAPPAAPVGSPARAAEVRERCLAVKRLMDRWMSGSYDNDWRRWNLGRWRARRAIASREAALRQVTCLDSGTEVPFGDRDTRKARPNEQWYSPPATTNASVAPPRM